MIRYPRILAGLLAFGMTFSFGAVNSRAEEQKDLPYKYQVTIYSGDQGTFTNAGVIQVVDKDGNTASNARIITSGDSIKVTVDAGSSVTFPNVAADGVVDLGANSLYYVKGVRKSGYDNSTVAAIDKVYQDQDYVVAYGIRGDNMVRYMINYEDESGRTLAPSNTFYGNIGDRPVAAYLHIEGYEPQAYNLTKTLSKNEADNEFTFIYRRVSGGGASGGTGGAEDTAAAETPGTGAAGTTDAQTGTAGGGAAAGAGGSEATEDAGIGEEEIDVPDEDIPQDAGPEDLISLDDEEVPLIGNPGILEGGAINMLGATALSVTAAVMFIGVFIAFMKNRKKAKVKDKEKNN